MIDLTPYVSTTDQKEIGPLFLSDRASASLRELLVRYYPVECCAHARFAPVVAKSVTSFLTSDYFKQSAWFRRQKVHTVCVCSIATKEGTITPVFHVIASSLRGYTIVAPAECALPDTYFEQRVIEEVRVESGAVDCTAQWKGRA